MTVIHSAVRSRRRTKRGELAAMDEGLQFLDIIFFAMVAGFIFLRLRSVLGRRTGEERPPPEAQRNMEDKRSDDSNNVIAMPDRAVSPPKAEERPDPIDEWQGDESVKDGLRNIVKADGSFEPTYFLDGARQAYEMIVMAFAAGDRDTLQNLLSEDVFADFAAAVSEREESGNQMDTRITQIDSTDIIEADMNGRVAEVTVKFVSEMISVIKDGDGEVVGEPPREQTVTDIWTFARDTSSRDPNWHLIETSSEAS